MVSGLLPFSTPRGTGNDVPVRVEFHDYREGSEEAHFLILAVKQVTC